MEFSARTGVDDGGPGARGAWEAGKLHMEVLLLIENICGRTQKLPRRGGDRGREGLRSRLFLAKLLVNVM